MTKDFTKENYPMTETARKDFFQKVIDASYASLLGFELTDVRPDSLTLQMPVTAEKYGNVYGFVHGGAIMSLADTAMGCACYNLGRKVTTMDMNINFIKSAKLSGRLKAVAFVIHSGSRTMVAEAEIYDGEGVFIAKARGTFFVTGALEEAQPLK